MLIGEIEELLQKIGRFCVTYQHVNGLCTLFRYRLSEKVVARSGQAFDDVQKPVYYKKRTNEVDRKLSTSMMRLLKKKYKKQLLSSFQNSKLTKTGGSVFEESIEQLEKTKNEQELIKVVDCFLDGNGEYSGILVTFEIRSISCNHFLNPKVICKYFK